MADEQVHQGIAAVMAFPPHNYKRGSGLSRRNKGTWYDGQDLKNAACYDREGLPRFDATTNSYIGAMAMDDDEECYKCLQITNNNFPELSVTVMIVDKCAACTKKNWIDLPPGIFQQLSEDGDLNIGVLDISWKKVPCSQVKHHPKLPAGKH
ncbi:hypothetical protein BJV82DRAFT_666303 [Fennellomyces sp. T-0311]|nr:hypothetical protein BJV82DRAFT_666303 [Fennellomyces sp. T-0311]